MFGEAMIGESIARAVGEAITARTGQAIGVATAEVETISEEQRMAALIELDLLDTPDELEYNQLVQLACQVCDVPISYVSLIDRDRQWFKAAVGVAVRETPRDISFCTHTIQQSELFVVEDATQDLRFKDNPLVNDDPNVRFYAGMPIRAPGGAAVGTLCVVDTQPRTLSEGQRNALIILGLQVQARMELRLKRNLLEKALIQNHALTENLLATNSLFEKFMENGPFASYIKDAEGRYVFFRLHRVWRQSMGDPQLVGRTEHDVFPAEIADDHWQHDLEVMNSGEPQQFDEVTLDTKGEIIRWHAYKFPITGSNGEKLVAGISVDVTADLERQQALAEANLQLERLATTDDLTGIANRRFFQERIEIEFSVAVRKRRPLSMMLMDVDNFKSRNDELGHAAGDEALRFLGKMLRETVRMGDLPVRLGGEEFGVLLPDTNAEAALVLAKRFQDRMRTTPGAPANLTVSVGIAASNEATKTWEELLSQSDEAMYVAKRNGKNRVVIHGTVVNGAANHGTANHGSASSGTRVTPVSR